ncbi:MULTISPECIES: phosphate ABC transporter substrate-binding protein PstS [unclassified Corynebacterium]|uniref:phosphate ABC transporter substrate-binding protein PstS n=1 Tax=unclassified Corynebacterium TaxID=2624378 RepID=UPI0035235F6D
MRNRSRRAALLGGIAIVSLAATACSESADTTVTGSGGGSIEGLSGTTGTLSAEGASSQQKAMDLFGTVYQQQVSGAQFNYTASGSGSGQKQFIAGQVAFGGSDSPLSDEQIPDAEKRCGGNEVWHLPLVIGPVAVAYNLEGVSDDIVLSPEVIAKIFGGKITSWNDPAIAKLNDGVDLPDTSINVIYRSEESGTSDNFQKFLKASAPNDWSTTGKSFPSATGAGANGSNGVVSEVSKTNGGITYVEAGFATEQGLKIAQIDFGEGAVELNDKTVGEALDNLTYKTEGHNMVVDSAKLFEMKKAGAYPLVLTTYEIVCSAGYDEETSKMVKDFLTVALGTQNERLEKQGYIPVSGAYAQKLKDAVDAIQ